VGEDEMSIDLVVDVELGDSGQYVRDQEGNSSTLSLTKERNVGIGTTTPDPNHALEVNGSVKIKSSVVGTGLHFADSDFSLGAVEDGFRLQKGGWRIFEVYGKNGLSFDNVNVYPDNDQQQSLGLQGNRWADLHVVNIVCTGELSIGNLETPPPNAEIVDLVMDKNTGKIYRRR